MKLTPNDILSAIRSTSYSHEDLQALIGAVASVAGARAADFDGMEAVTDHLDAAFDGMEHVYAWTDEQRDEFAADARGGWAFEDRSFV